MPTDYSVKVIAALYGVSQWEKCSDSGDVFFLMSSISWAGEIHKCQASAEFWSQSGPDCED